MKRFNLLYFMNRHLWYFLGLLYGILLTSCWALVEKNDLEDFREFKDLSSKHTLYDEDSRTYILKEPLKDIPYVYINFQQKSVVILSGKDCFFVESPFISFLGTDEEAPLDEKINLVLTDVVHFLLLHHSSDNKLILSPFQHGTFPSEVRSDNAAAFLRLVSRKCSPNHRLWRAINTDEAERSRRQKRTRRNINWSWTSYPSMRFNNLYSQPMQFQSDDPMADVRNFIKTNEASYNSPTFKRKGSYLEEPFKHYRDFYDTSPIISYEPSTVIKPEAKVQENIQNIYYPQTVNKNKKYDILESLSRSTKKSKNSGIFPKSIIKDGQIFYRQDLTKRNDEKGLNNNLPIEKSEFEKFTENAEKLNKNNSGKLREKFNAMLDQVREIGSQVPITSAVITGAGVQGNSEGIASNTIGAALNRGYFAAVAKGRTGNNQVQSTIEGDGKSVRGSASVSAVEDKSVGVAAVQVDHSHAGVVHSQSLVGKGDASAYANIEHKFKKEKDQMHGQSYGESKSSWYPKSSNIQDENPPSKKFDVNVIEGILETVHQPKVNFPNYFANNFSPKIITQNKVHKNATKENFASADKQNMLPSKNLIKKKKYIKNNFNRVKSTYPKNLKYNKTPYQNIKRSLNDEKNNWTHSPYFDQEENIPNEELYPNSYDNPSSSYEDYYTSGDSIDYDYGSSIHNSLFDVPEPEPFPLSPLAPNETSETDKYNTESTTESEIFISNIISSSLNTSVLTSTLNTTFPHATAEPPFSQSTIVPVNEILTSRNLVLEINPNEIVTEKVVTTTLKPTIIATTTDKQIFSMMPMTFLNPGKVGMFQYIEPLQPKDPYIKLWTMESQHRTNFNSGKGTIVQPGKSLPGFPNYKVPIGFRGRFYLGDLQPKVRIRNSKENNQQVLIDNFQINRMRKSTNHFQLPNSNRFNGYKNKYSLISKTMEDCGYYDNSCDMLKNFKYSTLCTPVYIQVPCCC